MRIALIGPAHPYKGGGARHTTELARWLAAAGHDVVIESWSRQYPAGLYPGGRQTVDVPEGEPFPHTRRDLSWRNPAGWAGVGRRLRDRDLVVFALLIPPQAIPYLVILAALRGVRGPRRLGRGRREGRAAPRTVVVCHNVLPHEKPAGRRAADQATAAARRGGADAFGHRGRPRPRPGPRGAGGRGADAAAPAGRRTRRAPQRSCG